MPAKGVDSCVLTGEALLARFTALDAFLTEHQALWKPRPFTHLRLPWEASCPELAAWLRERTLEDAENAHNQPAELVDAPEPFAYLYLLRPSLQLRVRAADQLRDARLAKSYRARLSQLDVDAARVAGSRPTQ